MHPLGNMLAVQWPGHDVWLAGKAATAAAGRLALWNRGSKATPRPCHRHSVLCTFLCWLLSHSQVTCSSSLTQNTGRTCMYVRYIPGHLLPQGEPQKEPTACSKHPADPGSSSRRPTASLSSAGTSLLFLIPSFQAFVSLLPISVSLFKLSFSWEEGNIYKNSKSSKASRILLSQSCAGEQNGYYLPSTFSFTWGHTWLRDVLFSCTSL